MHASHVEGNFTQESGQALKPRVVEAYNAYMGVCGQIRQWSTAMELPAEHGSRPRTFFHLTDMSILNAYLIHKSCGGKMTYKNSREILFRKLIIHSQEKNVTVRGTSRGRPSATASQLSRLGAQII
jgi:hypothetical protein